MKTKAQVIEAMKNCEQMKGLSVLDHGISVNKYFKDLINHLQLGTDLEFEWKLPNWITENREYILNNLLPLDILDEYQIYHDCGKPYCREVDSKGRVHFPNHAKISSQIWKEVGGLEQVCKLMEMDMDIHLLKDVGVEEFSKRPEAISLLVTGLCELHSNAIMFGGIDQVSFKIKWKNINKRGNAIFKKIK